MDKILIDRGYKQYQPTALDSDIVVACFQKRFDDEHGKKYFINVKKNDMSFIPESHRGDYWKKFSYDYEVQVTFGEDERAVNLEMFSGWSIEQVEKFMDEFFEKMGPNYYESWDTEERQVSPANNN
jgi:hypothetical protein